MEDFEAVLGKDDVRLRKLTGVSQEQLYVRIEICKAL